MIGAVAATLKPRDKKVEGILRTGGQWDLGILKMLSKDKTQTLPYLELFIT